LHYATLGGRSVFFAPISVAVCATGQTIGAHKITK
jgi:hypothetical protein